MTGIVPTISVQISIGIVRLHSFMLINMLNLCFSKKYLNLSCVFLFWKEDGGGLTKPELT